MPDLAHLLQQPAGLAKRPPVLQADDYPGIIKGYTTGDDNKNKTPYLRMTLGLTDWPEGLPIDQRPDVDLSKRQLRKDFFLTDDALWRLDEFLASCGVVIDPSQRIPYSEILPQLIGAEVMVEVQQYQSNRTGERGNQVGKIVGMPAYRAIQSTANATAIAAQ